MKRPTFKKSPRETGLRAVCAPAQETEIKLDGVLVGAIVCLRHADSWNIRFRTPKTPTKDEPCAWKWVQLRFSALTEPECRDFVRLHWEALCIKYNLSHFQKE